MLMARQDSNLQPDRYERPAYQARSLAFAAFPFSLLGLFWCETGAVESQMVITDQVDPADRIF
jgi:hypothetical protein